jgi:hypothetical protein
MIKIGLLLDACCITYTEAQLSKLENLVQNLIEQHIYNAVKQLNSTKTISNIKKLTYPVVKSASMNKETSDNTTDTKSEKNLLKEDTILIKNEPDFSEETLSEIENDSEYFDSQGNENSKESLGNVTSQIRN